MLKKIKAWFASIIREEIERAETASKADAAAAEERIRTIAAGILKKGDALEASIKTHVSSELSKAGEPLKAAVASEVTKHFENILGTTKIAAQEALAEARRTLRMVCNSCGQMSWKFIVNTEGKVVCGDCQSRGVK
jgi:hypothetical protein